ncbi:MAG: ribonuclease HI family protein [Spirochaetota bacterium]
MECCPGEEKILRVFLDGGSRGNPGEAAIGFVVYEGNGKEIYRYGKSIGVATNNYAEYMALIEALRWLLEYRDNYRHIINYPIVICSDSELVVRQINSRYRVRDPHIAPLFKEARDMIEKIGCVELKHIRREGNKITDWIVNRVLDRKPFDILK